MPDTTSKTATKPAIENAVQKGMEFAKTSYIENSMRNGGIIKITGKPHVIVTAQMRWPNIVGRVRATGHGIVEALDNLDAALMQDAADEMVKNNQA